MTFLRTYGLNSALRFDIIQKPAAGSVRVLNSSGGQTEMLHLAVDQEAAERWLEQHRYSKAWCEPVTDVVEGPAATAH